MSPLHGDLSGLPRALMWCGTRDLLHVYPLLPAPEARRVFAQLTGFLS